MDKMQDFHPAIMYMQYFSISEDSYERHSGEAAKAEIFCHLQVISLCGISHWQDIYDTMLGLVYG